MEGYREKIERCALEKINEDLSNATMVHAEIGVENLFKNANDSVKIITSSFFAGFWRAMLIHMKSFLARGGSIELISIEPMNSQSSEIVDILRASAGQDKVINYGSLTNSIFDDLKIIPNVIIGDESITRCELEDDKMKEGYVSAVINFGDADRAAKYLKLFQALTKIAK